MSRTSFGEASERMEGPIKQAQLKDKIVNAKAEEDKKNEQIQTVEDNGKETVKGIIKNNTKEEK